MLKIFLIYCKLELDINIISAILFPCKVCGAHFRQMLWEYPIKHNNREELVYYICFLHNKVNERLNKPIFDCKKAFEFWGGDCGCSLNENKGKSLNSTHSNNSESLNLNNSQTFNVTLTHESDNSTLSSSLNTTLSPHQNDSNLNNTSTITHPASAYVPNRHYMN